MIPVQPFGSLSGNIEKPAYKSTPGLFSKDPTKPLRSSFESILLARSSVKALRAFDHFWARHEKFLLEDKMLSIAVIDQIEDWEKRESMLDKKVDYVLVSFNSSMRRALVHELNPKYRARLPEKVSTAYELLIQTEGEEQTIDGIMEAGLSFHDHITDLFSSAKDFYDGFLGYKASIRQIVDLVGNSYDTSTHLETGFHNQAALEADSYYAIATIGGVDRIMYLDPSNPHKIEKEMRAAGKIKDQLTHCPFAMKAQFTNPFQDNGSEIVESNPLKLVFESLVNKYIGS